MKTMETYKISVLFILIFLFGCQNQPSQQDDLNKSDSNQISLNLEQVNALGLDTLNLLRGEILLCGNGQFGDVSFSLSCDYDIRETFDLAISLLHSFEYAEAEKAFVQVIDADPDCAMAYWGVAMSIYHELWAPPSEKILQKGSDLLTIADALPKSERETEFLNAIGAYYSDWQTEDHKTRAKLMENEMEAIYNKYPDDAEAAIFYSLAILSTADPADKEYTHQLKSGNILEGIFPDQPNHPGIAHYIIHNYDYPELAHMALNTAREYADIAPASAHAQHMPSHIFTRLGLWEESIEANIRSASAAVCYSEETNMQGHWAQEIHALDYLVYAYLQQGNNDKANEQYEYLQAIDKIHPVSVFAIAYPFAAVPARLALENKNWKEAAQLQVLTTEQLPWEQFPWEESIIHFARSIGASHIGDVTLAEKELNILETLHNQLIQKEDQYKATQVMIQINASKAWIEFAKGNQDDALVFMKESVDLEDATEKHPVTPGEVLPARELLADMLFALGRYDEALVEYEKDIAIHPNRFNGFYGAATSAKETGDLGKAKVHFNKLIELTKSSNSTRPEIEEAKAFIDQNGTTI